MNECAKDYLTITAEIANIIGLIIIPIFIWYFTDRAAKKTIEKEKEEQESLDRIEKIGILQLLAVDMEMALELLIAAQIKQVLPYLEIIKEGKYENAVHQAWILALDIKTFSNLEKLSFIVTADDQNFYKTILQFSERVSSFSKHIQMFNENTKHSIMQINTVAGSLQSSISLEDETRIAKSFMEVQLKGLSSIKQGIEENVLFISENLLPKFIAFEKKQFGSMIEDIKLPEECIKYIDELKEQKTKNDKK